MAAIGISEFTFGYAFLYEQTHSNWANLRAAPILPSLQQEQDEGWDAHLPTVGADYYYQFKLTDHLSRSNSKFIADGTYSSDYYRLAFHRRNNNQQHQRLRLHAQTHPNTYYVAPEFKTIDEFNDAFLTRQIAARSRIIPLSLCADVLDGDQHYITFQDGNTHWIQHSEPKRHLKSYRGSGIELMYEEGRALWKSIDKGFAVGVFERAVGTVNRIREHERRRGEDVEKVVPLLEFDIGPANRAQVLRRASEILSVGLGVTLVIVGAVG